MMQKTVVVTGEFVLDWCLARAMPTPRAHVLWEPGYSRNCSCDLGGAYLLGELIRETAKKSAIPDQSAEVLKRPDPTDFPKFPGTAPFSHSYAVCSEFQKIEDRPDEGRVWRMLEFLGMEHPHPDRYLELPPAKPDDDGNANIVVFDAADYGFLDHKELWPKSLTEPNEGTWLLMKLTRPLFDEPPDSKRKWERIWEVANKFGERSVVVVTVNDLRTQGMRISRAHSWENTVEDLIREVPTRILPHIPYAYLVVSLFTEGAVVFSNHRAERQIHLYYDPKFMEGGWQKAHPGNMTGYTFCLIAGIAQQMIQSAQGVSAADIGRGVQAGLAAQRYLHLIGFKVEEAKDGSPSSPHELSPDMMERPEQVKPGSIAHDLHLIGFKIEDVKDGSPNPPNKPSPNTTEQPKPVILSFPIAHVAAALNAVNGSLRNHANHPGPFLEVRVDQAVSKQAVSKKDWTILDTVHEGGKEKDTELRELAERIVAWDISDEDIYRTLKAPIREFGKLRAIHRNEIENLTVIYSLIKEYACSPKQRVPLSIAVFGEPGSGKSFAIKAVAESLTSHGRPNELTFNLSQFTSPDSIVNSLHQVRDVALSSAIPLVFWDEFDTELGAKHLGWLRYFLAPMQDGKFQEGPVTHNIGQAVFVFAGGTSDSMDSFTKHALETPDVKGKDFVSRLKGYVDIASLDHPALESNDVLRPKRDVVLRRALLLRTLLLRAATELVEDLERFEDRSPRPRKHFTVDQGVLEAFLFVPRYKYGARSMESIVRMSMFSGKKMFERSILPSRPQLELHVDANWFLGFVDRIKQVGDFL